MLLVDLMVDTTVYDVDGMKACCSPVVLAELVEVDLFELIEEERHQLFIHFTIEPIHIT